MGRWMRRFGLCVLLGAMAPPAHALDPILMFLLSAAQEIALAAARRKEAAAPPVPVALPSTAYPGTSVEPRQLRRLIDECFLYLSEPQRREIFDSLHATLMDPKNAAVRASTIDYFVARAVTVREAQQRLSNLNETERNRLVAEFKGAVDVMPPEEAERIAGLLRQHVLPVPHELNAQLLAAIVDR